MNIKAIIASLVLGSSSAAIAAPSVTISATARGSIGTPSYGTSTTIVRDHRYPVAQPRQIYYRDRPMLWRGHRMPPVVRSVTLASEMHFANDGRTFITVGSQAGQFQKLDIRSATGRTFIKQVYVQFDNGQEQVLRNLDRTLVGNECLTLDLDGGRRSIRRIVVYGNELNNGFRYEPGTFNITAS
jgi:hypothetical protein